MQAQKGYENLSTFKTLSKVYQLSGIRGLYSGAIPPLWVRFIRICLIAKLKAGKLIFCLRDQVSTVQYNFLDLKLCLY
jgi:hypothetical protein